MMVFLKKYILNKYFLTGLAFVIWMVFFDQESFIDQIRISRTLKNMESQKNYYQEEIEKTRGAIQVFENDTAHLEKYAREKYYMKKDNEEVFVIIEEEE
jgi:cell division protein FtsB